MLALNGGEWSTSPTGSFIPRAREPETHWKGGWVGPTASLDAVEKGKISCSCKQLSHNSTVIEPAVYWQYWLKNPSFSIINIVTRLQTEGHRVQFLAGTSNLSLLHNVHTDSKDYSLPLK
jgi:hypothetical protein